MSLYNETTIAYELHRVDDDGYTRTLFSYDTIGQLAECLLAHELWYDHTKGSLYSPHARRFAEGDDIVDGETWFTPYNPTTGKANPRFAVLLREIPDPRLLNLYRMADYALWGNLNHNNEATLESIAHLAKLELSIS